MSLVINTNIGALNAQRSIAVSSDEMAGAMQRLASGKKINSAADDAAGFAIAERMTAQVRGLDMAVKNVNDSLSLLNVMQSGTSDVADMLQRMRELALQAANDTVSTEDRSYLQNEASALIAELNRVATQTQYNDQNLLDGTFLGKSVQLGANAGQSIHFSGFSVGTSFGLGNAFGFVHGGPASATSNVFDVEINPGVDAFAVNDLVVLVTAGGSDYSTTKRIASITQSGATQSVTLDGGVGQVTQANSIMFKVADFDANFNVVASGGSRSVANINISTRDGATAALDVIDRALNRTSQAQASYGAIHNRLEYTVSNLMSVSDNTTAARSRIEDADFAVESARLTKAQVLQSSGAAMLSQANASSQLVLSLIR